MVQLDTVRTANKALCQSRSLTAVFAGATAGIGEATLRALATAHGTGGLGLRAYVIGRKKEATEKILAECSRVCPTGNFVFVHARDLSLLEEVDTVCSEITKAVKQTSGEKSASIDLLCMSQGDFNFSPRKGQWIHMQVLRISLITLPDTKEGLEFRVALLYYSRMRLLINLLPLLLASDLPAHVVSVFAAGKEAGFNQDDISLRDSKNWGTMATRSQVSTMHTFFFEHLAAQHPGRLSLVHLFPGVVMTKAFKNPGVPLWGRTLFTVVAPLLRLMATPVLESGERTLFLASPQRFPARKGADQPTKATIMGDQKLAVATGTDGKIGSGAYGVNIDGETSHDAAVIEKYRAAGIGGKVWDHTMRAFDTISSGRVWSG